MGKKIFVSYKYKDNKVENLGWNNSTTVRDYVDKFQEMVDSEDDIYKGEDNDEDLGNLTDDEIWEILKNRIYDSSVTIIFLSPGMKESGKTERDQWIPWEVSYSLKETSRKTKTGKTVTSHSNAMLAVVLPDITGSYDWYLESRTCCESQCTTHHRDKLFEIIKENKFNRIKNVTKRTCNNYEMVWTGTCSYIEAVKWSLFIKCYQTYVNKAVDRQAHIDEYHIRKEV